MERACAVFRRCGHVLGAPDVGGARSGPRRRRISVPGAAIGMAILSAFCVVAPCVPDATVSVYGGGGLSRRTDPDFKRWDRRSWYPCARVMVLRGGSSSNLPQAAGFMAQGGAGEPGGGLVGQGGFQGAGEQGFQGAVHEIGGRREIGREESYFQKRNPEYRWDWGHSLIGVHRVFVD